MARRCIGIAGVVAWLNIAAILVWQASAFIVLPDDEAPKARGEPVFHPEKLGIKNADYWTGHQAEDNLEAERQHGGPPICEKM